MGSYVQFAHSPDILCLSSLLAVAAPLSSYATASAHTVRRQQADEQELDDWMVVVLRAQPFTAITIMCLPPL